MAHHHSAVNQSVWQRLELSRSKVLTLSLCFNNHCREGNTQGLCDGTSRIQTWIAQTRLNFSNVGLMESGLRREFLLAQFLGHTKSL